MGPLERKIIAFFIIHVFTFPDKHNGKIYIYLWTNCKAEVNKSKTKRLVACSDQALVASVTYFS